MSDHCTIDQQSYPMQPASACSSIAEVQEFDLASSSRRSRSSRRSSSRRRQLYVSKFILLALCFISSSTNAFSTSPLSTRRSIFSGSSSSSNNNVSSNQFSPSNKGRQPRFHMSAVAESPADSSSASRMSDFQRRMKGLVNQRRAGRMPAGQRAQDKPSNIKTVVTLEDYKQMLDENEGKMVVVRFFATWCKACKAIQPSYYRMATLYPHITFLEVPVTNENANLHQGLEVPSLPYGHIYYPEAGLVEEMKISKKYFHNLVKNVRWYDQGKCGLEDFVPSSSDNEDE